MDGNYIEKAKIFNVEVSVFFKNFKKSIDILLTYPEHERLIRNLELFKIDEQELNATLNFVSETVDGRYIGIVLNNVQALRFFLEPKNTYQDASRPERIIILLRGHEAFIEIAQTTDPDGLYDFFLQLASGSSYNNGSFLFFKDYEDEDIYINIAELSYIEAPTHVVKAGEPDDDEVAPPPIGK